MRIILDVCGCLFILLIAMWIFQVALIRYYERLNHKHHEEIMKELAEEQAREDELVRKANKYKSDDFTDPEFMDGEFRVDGH